MNLKNFLLSIKVLKMYISIRRIYKKQLYGEDKWKYNGIRTANMKIKY